MAADRTPPHDAARMRAPVAIARLAAVFAALTGAGVVALLAATSTALAQPAPGPLDPSRIETASKRSSVAIKSVQPTHVWHDGTSARMLTLDETLEAYFPGGLPPQGHVLRPAGSTDRAAAAQVSPVLRDESGRPRGLPGGVVVVLKTPMDEAAARALIGQAGAVALQALSDRLWLVQGPIGLGSLTLANQMQADGRFESAQPNWWMPRTRK